MTKKSGPKRTPAHVRQIVQSLSFELTDDEKVNRAEIAGKKRKALLELGREFDQVKSSYKGRLETLELEISAALEAVETGKEYREVLCDEVKDYDKRVVQIVHLGKVHNERTMTAGELQLTIADVQQ